MVLSATAMRFLVLVLLLVLGMLGAQVNGDDAPEKELVCFNGYVMDHYCIERGTLLDATSLASLEYPDRHSIHCLVDVSQCRRDGYEVLLDPMLDANGNPQTNKYGRVFRLDAMGNVLVLDLARTVGSCSTCYGGGTQARGFRATVIGYRHKNGTAPELLEVTEMRPDDQPCTVEEGGQFVPINVSFETRNGAGVNPVSVHGAIMVTAWGILVPLAILSSMLLRHRPGGTWFLVHRICNGLAVGLTAIGIIYAFANFGSVFGADSAAPSRRHGSLGLTTFCCGCVQALLGVCRPHLAEKEKEVKEPSEDTTDGGDDNNESQNRPAAAAAAGTTTKSVQRRLFEVVHKSLGYATMALAYTTLYFGAKVSGSKQNTFFRVWYALFGFAGVVALWMLWDKCENAKREKGEKNTTASATNKPRHNSNINKADDNEDLEKPEDEFSALIPH